MNEPPETGKKKRIKRVVFVDTAGECRFVDGGVRRRDFDLDRFMQLGGRVDETYAMVGGRVLLVSAPVKFLDHRGRLEEILSGEINHGEAVDALRWASVQAARDRARVEALERLIHKAQDFLIYGAEPPPRPPTTVCIWPGSEDEAITR